jgi:hypothetical protein
MNNYAAEKFGSDNAACEQDGKTASGKIVTEDELLALQEETLKRQSAGEAVHDEGPEEEEELEEVEDFDGEEYGLDNLPEMLKNEEEYFGPQDTPLGDEYGSGADVYEGLDHRYDRTEYYFLTEELDWDKLESDPTQLFTIGNSKVAADTIIYNLQPARFCPSFENGMCKIVQPVGGEFKIACYAYQDERQYDVALQLRLRQMRFWDTHSAEDIYKKLEEFYYHKKVRGGSMVYAIGKGAKTKTAHRAARKATHLGRPEKGSDRMPVKSKKLKYIRFNQSGDLKDKEDAIKMDEVARLAKEKLGLDSYSYTARKDILNQYKFKYVHMNGSGFNAVTAINEPVAGGRGVKSLGKTFAAFPSLRDKKGNWMERDPKVKIYYEDIFEKLLPDGSPNPKFDKYTKVNPSGWYACPGDCNSCPACKVDKFKNIAVKIHRSFHKIASDWHDVEKVGAKGYRVHQKFDPYERGKKGEALKWSKEMEAEYEARAEKLRKQDEFSKLPKKEKEKIAADALNHEYEAFDIDMNPDSYEDWQKIVKKWEDKVKKLKLNVPIAKMRAAHGVPDNRTINKTRKLMTAEDIDKFATEEEKEFLRESMGDKVMDWKSYAAKLKKKSIDELLYMRKDAYEAAQAGDDLEKAGLPNNGGYYWDEVHMITDELRRRKKELESVPLDPEPIYGNDGEEIKDLPDDDYYREDR